MAQFTIQFDGSCWPNPGGVAAYGYTLSSQGELLDSGHGVIGTGEGMTNNVAEFWALWQGLQSALVHVPAGSQLRVLGDSQLVIKIMNRQWRPKSDKLYYPTYEGALDTLKAVRRRGVTVSLDWVPRKLNQACDDLSKAHNKVF
jgi:ribonuclease HI